MKKKKEKEQEILQKAEDAAQKVSFSAAAEAADADPAKAMEEDISLFHTLFPEVKAEEIPQEVWDRVEKGESLAASYALFAVTKYREEERIQKVNEENGKKAPPRVDAAASDGDYFSPEAVKSMTRSEIRRNYDKILSSMEKWN